MSDYNLPLIYIGILSYNRYIEPLRTIEALSRHLRYPASRLRWVISDDSTPDADHIYRLKTSNTLKALNVEVISTHVNSGLGANANRLHDYVFEQEQAEYMLFMEDDWILHHPLDLRAAIGIFTARPEVGYIRYRGHGGNDMKYTQAEANMSAFYPEYREGFGLHGRINYLQIDIDSPSLYVYTNGPHLKTRAFWNYFGRYPEGKQVGATEEAMAWAVKDKTRNNRASALQLVTLPEFLIQRFDHIGAISNQGAAHDLVRQGL